MKTGGAGDQGARIVEKAKALGMEMVHCNRRRHRRRNL